VIPESLVIELELCPLRTIAVAGLGMGQQLLNTYAVSLQIRQLNPVAVEVLAHPAETHVLLGRDVLNQFRVILDGPNFTLEIG